MEKKYVDQWIDYDGSQLTSLWAMRKFALQGDSIVAFEGGCLVEGENLVDQVDFISGDLIRSEHMLHFLVEHFDPDLPRTILRQRLLICQIREALADLAPGESLLRRGDDLFRGERKLSVSIATVSPVSGHIHAGLNVTSALAPVAAIGLEELGVDPLELACLVIDAYAAETVQMAVAKTKVRWVP